MPDVLSCSCGGRLRVLETRPIEGGKRRRRRCERCGETYTTVETVLREGAHNAAAMVQSHRIFDRILLLDPDHRQLVAAMVDAFGTAEARR